MCRLSVTMTLRKSSDHLPAYLSFPDPVLA